MIRSADKGEECGGKHTGVPGAGHQKGEHGLPCRRRQCESRQQNVSRSEYNLNKNIEYIILSRPAHDESNSHTPDSCAYRLRYQSYSSLGCRQAFDLKIDGSVEEERVKRHGYEPVRQAGGEHGPIEEKLDWYYRLGGVLAFDVDEEQEGDER